MGITKIQVLKKRHFHLSALGIEAASFAEQRYSGKPDGEAGTPR